MKSCWSNRNCEESSRFVMTKLNNELVSPTKKNKRFRSAFTTDQVNCLETQFKKFPYIGNTHRREVALALHIPERAVKIWFQNRRMKEKKECVTREHDDNLHVRKSIENHFQNMAQPSLPLLEENKKTSVSKKLETNNDTCDVNNKSSLSEAKKSEKQNVITYRVAVDIISENKASSESTMDLSKKYTTSESIKRTRAIDSEDIKLSFEQMAKTESFAAEQVFPVDLSVSKKTNISTSIGGQVSPQDTSENALPIEFGSNHQYLSVMPTVSPVYTQSYVASSGVLWKPINFMPLVSSNTPVLSNNLLELEQGPTNNPRRRCNCDCHLITPVSVALRQDASSAQYVITAVPYQNPSLKFP